MKKYDKFTVIGACIVILSIGLAVVFNSREIILVIGGIGLLCMAYGFFSMIASSEGDEALKELFG